MDYQRVKPSGCKDIYFEISVQFLWNFSGNSEQLSSMLQMESLLFSFLFQCFYLFIFIWLNIMIYDYMILDLTSFSYYEQLFCLTLKWIYKLKVNSKTARIQWPWSLNVNVQELMYLIYGTWWILCSGVDVPDLRYMMDFMYWSWCTWSTEHNGFYVQELMYLIYGTWWILCTKVDVPDLRYMIDFMFRSWCTWSTVHDGFYLQELMYLIYGT